MQNQEKCSIVIPALEVPQWTKYSVQSAELYADKFGFDVHVLNKRKYHKNNIFKAIEKFQVYELFDRYDRILLLDADTLITPQCPNVFSVVPKDSIGVVFEDVGSRRPARRQEIQTIQRTMGKIDWTQDYFNSGVMVLSSMHKEIFKFPQNAYTLQWGGYADQSYINWKTRRLGFKFQHLDFKYNHLSMFSEPWHGNKPKRESFIIHYAGNQEVKAQNLEKDFTHFYGGINA